VCTGIKTMGVKINFRQFPTGYDIFSGFYVLSVRHPNKKYFPLLHLCNDLKPFGVYVNFRRTFRGSERKRINLFFPEHLNCFAAIFVIKYSFGVCCMFKENTFLRNSHLHG
jgi:hypothetical protein